MKNYLTYISALVIITLLASCSGVGYSKADKKAADKACSCFKDMAKQSVDIHEWHADNFDDLEDLQEEKIEALKNGEKWSTDSKLIDRGEEMIEEWQDLYKEARDVCYDHFIDDGGDFYKEEYMSPDGETPVVPDLASEFCPEVFFAMQSLPAIEKKIQRLAD